MFGRGVRKVKETSGAGAAPRDKRQQGAITIVSLKGVCACVGTHVPMSVCACLELEEPCEPCSSKRGLPDRAPCSGQEAKLQAGRRGAEQ